MHIIIMFYTHILLSTIYRVVIKLYTRCILVYTKRPTIILSPTFDPTTNKHYYDSGFVLNKITLYSMQQCTNGV